MDEHPDMQETEDPNPDDTPENADPPRPVRGILWVFAPALAGAAVGAAWSAYYAAAQRLDPAAPIWVGGAFGLGLGAFLWAFFPYKHAPRKQPNSPRRGSS